MHEILLFGNSALYLNIMLECYQVVFGHHLGPRIIHIGEEFVKICNLGFLVQNLNFSRLTNFET